MGLQRGFTRVGRGRSTEKDVSEEGGSGGDDGRGHGVGRKNEAAGSRYLEKISFLLCYIGGNLHWRFL